MESVARMDKPLSLNLKSEQRTTHVPGLLTISAELRNSIYAYVLTKSKKITLSNKRNEQQPGLLRTCRQIRKEAIGIYYNDNKFVFLVHNYDGMKAMAAFDVVRKYNGNVRKNLVIDLCSGCTTVHVCKLQSWLQAYYDDPQVPSLRQDKRVEDSDQQTLARRTFGVVKSMRNRRWEDVEDVLESFFRAIDMFQDMEEDEYFTDEDEYSDYDSEDDFFDQDEDESDAGKGGEELKADESSRTEESAQADEADEASRGDETREGRR